MNDITEKLEEMFKDVEDITDRTNMDKVLMILDDIRIEDEDYVELLVSILKDELIDWNQPWYQVSPCLTRKPKIPEDVVEQYETGTFTKAEFDRVQRNWSKLVKKYNIPNTPTRLARWKNRNAQSKIHKHSHEEYVRHFIIAYLARGLKRDLYQVNRHFIQTYRPQPMKGKYYTPIEEKVMEICFYHDPKNATTILSSVLGREPRGIYNKLSEYLNGKPESKKIKWTLREARNFIGKLMLHSGCTFSELKNKKFEREVWMKMEEDVGQQHKHLQAFWYGKLHVQLFSQCSINSKSLRKLIFKQLTESPYQIWTDIRWKQVVLKFPDGFTDAFLYKMAHTICRQQPNYLKRPLSEIIKASKDHMKHTKRNRRLKNLTYDEEGNLIYVKYDKKLEDIMLYEN